MSAVRQLPDRARILIVRLRRLGDLLLLTPTLRAIRRRYPEAQIDLVVLDGFHHALLGNPNIDRLIVLGRGTNAWLRTMRACARGRYDAVLDFQSSPRSLWLVLAAHAHTRIGWRKRGVRDWVYTHHAPGWDEPIYVARNFLRFASIIGLPPTSDLGLELAITAADRARADAVLAQVSIHPQRPIVALSVVSKVDRKRWAAQSYAELADRIQVEHGAQLVFTSGPGELEQVRAVVERMQRPPALWSYEATTLGGLAAIYERCHLWIGNDGGAKHVASAAGCPTVVLIKAGDERFWTDTDDPWQVAVCDPQPERHHPNSLEGIAATQALRVVAEVIGRLRGCGRFP